MSDISQIVMNDTLYDIKDAVARTRLESINQLQESDTSPSDPTSKNYLYSFQTTVEGDKKEFAFRDLELRQLVNKILVGLQTGTLQI